MLSGGCTELMQAAYKGDTKKAPTRFAQRTAMCFSAEVKALVDGGADINQQDAYGWTAVAGSDSVRDRQVECLRWAGSVRRQEQAGPGRAQHPRALVPGDEMRMAGKSRALRPFWIWGPDVNIASKTGRRWVRLL